MAGSVGSAAKAIMKKIIEWCVLGFAVAGLAVIGWVKLPVILYNRGNEYFDKKQYNNALIYFQKSIAINPSIAVVQYSLGNTYQLLGDEPAAISFLKKAIELDRRLMQPYRVLATIYSNQARYDDALALLTSARSSLGNNSDIEELIESTTAEYLAVELNSAADAYIAADRFLAYKLVNKAIQVKSDYAYAYYTLGFFFYADKDFDKAQEPLQRALQLDSQMWLARRILGDIAFERGEYMAAVAQYQAAVSIWHDSAALYNNLGLAFMNLERYDEAIEPLENALRIESDNINIRYSLASVYRDINRTSDALREYTAVVRQQPDFPNVHNDIAAIYENLGHVEDARREYKQEMVNTQSRLRDAAQDPLALASLAYAYCGSGLFDKAYACAQQALRVSPGYRETYLALAKIYNMTNRPAEALVVLEKARKLGRCAGFITAQIVAKKRELMVLADNPQALRSTHIVFLKNGRKLRGVIKKEFPDKILLETQVGNSLGEITLYRNTIEQISAAE